MKKVLALVLAVMMLATVAFAAELNKYGCDDVSSKASKKADVTPGGSLKIALNYSDSGSGVKVYGSKDQTSAQSERALTDDEIDLEDPTTGIFRSVTTDNYSVTRIKYEHGKSLITGVTINDKEERVEVNFKDDLNNTGRKDFEVRFTLKGKGKMTLKADEVDRYNLYMGLDGSTKAKEPADIGEKVSLPDAKFLVIGTVGYGKVEMSIGDDQDEEIEDLESHGIKLDSDVVKFVRSTTLVPGYTTRVAGAYTADAILTEEYGDAFTLEARVYHNDVLFFDVDNAPDRDIIGRLADSDADMDFYVFNSDTKFTTFNSNAKLYFNDAEENDFVYQVKDKKLVKVGSYSEDDGCWVVKTRTLGTYVVSDVELKEFEATGSVDGNPDTGANDVVGIATALAAVALVSAAAVSLKK